MLTICSDQSCYPYMTNFFLLCQVIWNISAAPIMLQPPRFAVQHSMMQWNLNNSTMYVYTKKCYSICQNWALKPPKESIYPFCLLLLFQGHSSERDPSQHQEERTRHSSPASSSCTSKVKKSWFYWTELFSLKQRGSIQMEKHVCWMTNQVLFTECIKNCFSRHISSKQSSILGKTAIFTIKTDVQVMWNKAATGLNYLVVC